MAQSVHCDAAVFPARAGMSRRGVFAGGQGSGFPRPRGDEPFPVNAAFCLRAFSPPARG